MGGAAQKAVKEAATRTATEKASGGSHDACGRKPTDGQDRQFEPTQMEECSTPARVHGCTRGAQGFRKGCTGRGNPLKKQQIPPRTTMEAEYATW